MALNIEAYALAKKYTNETAIQFGGLKGAPAKIKSIVKQNGQNIITFQWTNDDGDIRESILTVDDGTPIYPWTPDRDYQYGDLIIYESNFYRCTTPNHDTVFNEDHWAAINSPDGAYGLVTLKSELPVRFTPADRKIYYVKKEGVFYYWNGTSWERQSISDEDIDDLFL